MLHQLVDGIEDPEVRVNFINNAPLLGCIAKGGYFVALFGDWTEVLGWSRQELQARPYIDLIHPEDRRKTPPLVHWEGGGSHCTGFENRYSTKSGGWVWLHWFAVEKNGVEYAFAQDVTLWKTNQKVLESTVLARTVDLQRSNEELREFVYAASHDLREPLLKVKAFGERLRDRCGGDLDDKGKQYLEVMLSAADRMQHLMDDLLSYSRVAQDSGADDSQPVDLNLILKEVQDDLGQRISETTATIEVDPLPTVVGNPPQMRTVFQNLISNSIKFQHPDRIPHIHVSAKDEGNSMVVSVQDNGIGFEPQFKDRIFKLFERLHTRFHYPGTGIGLALCKKIVERHRGWIEGEGIPGEGSVFRVGFPKNKVP